VGFELEFTGLTLEQTENIVLNALSGSISNKTPAEAMIASEHGEFKVEVDWDYLKRKARDDNSSRQPLELLSEVATLLVPIEVVCPPIAIDNLSILDNLVKGLRDAGAKGTDNSMVAAYGVHINAEIPALNAETIDAYLKAFALLQWWLVDAHQVNMSRRLTPYIDLYPDAYLLEVTKAQGQSIEAIIDTYLKHNSTRNRALDMLPMFSEVDSDRVKRAIDDPRINPRPTFHYRLPNCQIDKDDWSPAGAWNLWWLIEELANKKDELNDLCSQFVKSERSMLGIDRSHWIKAIDTWLKDRELV
jgi:hypothetical protein